MTIHDVIFKFRPGDYGLFDRMIYNVKTAQALKHADTVVVISEQTKKDLVQYYGANAGKIRIVYQDADPVFRTAPDSALCERIREQHGLGSNFWLFVGATNPRKNLPQLIEAWKQVPAADRLPLVITGPERSRYGKKMRKLIEASGGATAGLKWLGETDKRTLHALYHLADALLYPSLYEGFGLPVLESLYSGTPVMISETLGFDQWRDRGVYPIDATSTGAMAEQMKKMRAGLGTPPVEELTAIYGAENNLQKLVDIYTDKK